MRRFGGKEGKLENIIKNRMRHAINSNVIVTYEVQRLRSIRTLEWFFLTNKRFTLKTRYLFDSVYFMQNQLFCRCISLSAKIEVLYNYWKWFLLQLTLANMQVKSKKMGELIVQIGNIPGKVINEVLK